MGSTHPYYRKSKPKPQNRKDFLNDISLKQVIQRLRDQGVLPQDGIISIKELNQRFQPVISGSMRSLLFKMFERGAKPPEHINLTNAHMEPYGVPDPVTRANDLFDKRAAAAVSSAVEPLSFNDIQEITEVKPYDDAPNVRTPTVKSLVALAYSDYFPSTNDDSIQRLVSEAILASNPGWCGSIGPGIDNLTDLLLKRNPEGNYDMTQMHLLQIAYRYYDELSSEAREHLITVLLARGRIHRVNLDDTFTSGVTPNDWSRAGFATPAWVTHKRIGETENHILLISTARYLTNQLLYQRNRDPIYDNRRNGSEDRPSCTDLMLYLLRNILRNDFSEYNAKPYQRETRSALLNLCSYAYDHEVRLAARMVLDYVSARIAISSSDLRRMVPFRRRNETKFGRVAQLSGGFMAVGLLEEWRGADPMVERFAMQAGNTRALEKATQDRPFPCSIASSGDAAVTEVLSDYRLPPSIHDLFVSDLHRRFFQRLHRVPQAPVEVTGRNCDNYEIYAGSPSYLITAGGKPATYAIDPRFAGIVPPGQAQQLGVALTTSFIPTTEYNVGAAQSGRDLIQFSSFSDKPDEVENYGVAPDFACGYKVYLPSWVPESHNREFLFVDRKYYGQSDIPGYYLAIFRDGDFGLLEAFDCWLHPDLTFEQFKASVLQQNSNIRLLSNVESQYITHNGNQLHFVIWNNGERDNAKCGAKILQIAYGSGEPEDTLINAGNDTSRFLNGTILNSLQEGVVTISNPSLGTTITLDMSDQKHPRRISETGEVEEAGFNNEVWVDFGWTGSSEGDFFHPFNTIAAAIAAVADRGVIKIMPGSTRERPLFARGKRFRLVAPIGGVTIGSR